MVKTKNIYERTISVSKVEIQMMKEMYYLNLEQIYSRFGLCEDEAFTYTAVFDNGIEVDIKFVITDDEPYVEGVIFRNGYEIYPIDSGDDSILGIWEFDVDDNLYIVNVVEE